MMHFVTDRFFTPFIASGYQEARHYIILFILSLMGFSGFAQAEEEDSTRFVLTLSFYNHAELVYNGAVTYRFTNDYLGISRRNLFDKEEKPLYSANIGKTVSDPVRLLRLDTLQMIYNNPCVMSTSGNEYFISLETGTKEKRMHLHHYYHPQIEQLINTINAIVPEEHRIPYMSKDTKQDCEP